MRIYLLLIFIVLSGLAGTSFAAGTVSTRAPDVTRLAVHAPTPELPVNPANFRGIFVGTYLLRVQIRSGAVTQVIISQSTKDTVLDKLAVKALRTWRFKPGMVPYRKISSVPMSPPQTKQETLIRVPVIWAFKE